MRKYSRIFLIRTPRGFRIWMSECETPRGFRIVILGADYMEIFNRGGNFNSLNRVEILSRLNSKFLFKMTLQLHVKLSTRYTWLKFQLGSAKQMKFQRGMKILNFPYNRHSFQPGLKIWYYARKNALFIFKKIKMTTCSQARF